MKSGKTQNLNTFSKQLVLERLHGKVGILDTLKYRIAVFLVRSLVLALLN